MTENSSKSTNTGQESIQKANLLPSPNEEFSRDFVASADRLIAFDERRPISTLQRKLRMGYNGAGRLYNLITTRRIEMSNDYKMVLEGAWEHAIKHFNAGKVNSECTLHAYLYAQLNAALPDCTILCEPRLSINHHGDFYPDIVVINDQKQLVAILEVKFVPHGFPVFEGDIAKLRAIAIDGIGSLHELLLNPETGKFSDFKVTISAECLISFAAIGHADAKAVYKDVLVRALCMGGHEALEARFVPLVGRTNLPNPAKEQAE